MFFAAILLLVLPAESCSEKLKPALVALQQKNPAEASSILESNRADCAETPFYSELSGAANELSGKVGAAVQAYEKAVSLQPEIARVHFELGAVYVENQQPEEAVQQFKLGLQFDPSNVAGQRYLVGIYVQLKDWQNASRFFEALGAFQHPQTLTDPLMLLLFARVLIETGKTDQLPTIISPDNPGINSALLFSLGGLFAEHRMYSQVVRFLSRIPDADADDAVYFNLADGYSHLQDFDKARTFYFRAIDKHPWHIEAYFHVGVDYAASGQPNKSVPWLAQAHLLASDRADIKYALAEQLIDLGYFNSADELLNTGSDDILLLTASADLKAAEGQSDRATQLYQAALAKSPLMPQALIGLARMQISQDKDNEAQQSLNLALSQSPGNIEAEGELGRLEYKQGQWDSATLHLEKAWNRHHLDSKVGFELARAYRKGGRLADSFRLLSTLEPSLRGSPAYHLELSQLCAQMRKADQSKLELDRYTALQKTGAASVRFESARSYVF